MRSLIACYLASRLEEVKASKRLMALVGTIGDLAKDLVLVAGLGKSLPRNLDSVPTPGEWPPHDESDVRQCSYKRSPSYDKNYIDFQMPLQTR